MTRGSVPRIGPATIAFWAIFGLFSAALYLITPEKLEGDLVTWNELARQLCLGVAPYKTAFDNKDPGFLFAITVTYCAVGSIGSLVLQVLPWLAVSLTLSINLLKNRGPLTASAFLIWMAILIHSPFFWIASLSTLIPAALVVLAYDALARSRLVLSGILVSVVVLVKLNFLPLAIGLLPLFLVLERREKRKLIVGFGVSISIGLLVLNALGYISSWPLLIRMNADYAAQAPELLGSRTRIDLIWRALGEMRGLSGLVLLLEVGLVVLILLLPGKANSNVASLSSAVGFRLSTILFAVSGVLIIAIGFVWQHHFQALLPALILGVYGFLFDSTLEETFKIRAKSALAFASSVLIAIIFLFATFTTKSNPWLKHFDTPKLSIEFSRQFKPGDTYAYLLTNDVIPGNAIPGYSHLACPAISTYPFIAGILKEQLHCLENTDVVIVRWIDFSRSNNYGGNGTLKRDFDSYLRNVRGVLKSKFTPVYEESDLTIYRHS